MDHSGLRRKSSLPKQILRLKEIGLFPTLIAATKFNPTTRVCRNEQISLPGTPNMGSREMMSTNWTSVHCARAELLAPAPKNKEN